MNGINRTYEFGLHTQSAFNRQQSALRKLWAAHALRLDQKLYS